MPQGSTVNVKIKRTGSGNITSLRPSGESGHNFHFVSV